MAAAAPEPAKLPNPPKSRSGTLEPVYHSSPGSDFYGSEDHGQASSSSAALLVRRTSAAGSDRVHLERSRSNSSSFSDLSSAPSDATTAMHKADKDEHHSSGFLKSVFGGKKSAVSEITEVRSVVSVDSLARSSVGTSSPARSDKSDKSGASDDGRKKGITERHMDRLKQLEKRKCAFR